MDQATIIDIARKYKLLIENYIHPKQVVLFGSYSKGTQRPDSDIDLAILVDKIDDTWLRKSAQLYQLTRQVDVRIEPILLDRNNDPSGFVKHILAEGISI